MENENRKFKDNSEKLEFLDKKVIEIQEVQEAELLLDFDKCLEEVKEKPYKVKFAGREFIIPREMPFDFSLFFFRHCYKKKNGIVNMEVPEEKMMEFIKLMFGNEMLRALETSKKRVGINFVFERLATPIMEKWGYGTNKETVNEKKMLTQE